MLKIASLLLGAAVLAAAPARANEYIVSWTGIIPYCNETNGDIDGLFGPPSTGPGDQSLVGRSFTANFFYSSPSHLLDATLTINAKTLLLNAGTASRVTSSLTTQPNGWSTAISDLGGSTGNHISFNLGLSSGFPPFFVVFPDSLATPFTVTLGPAAPMVIFSYGIHGIDDFCLQPITLSNTVLNPLAHPYPVNLGRRIHRIGSHHH